MKRIAILLLPLMLTGCSVISQIKAPAPTPVNNEETRAVDAAKKLYQQQKDQHRNFSGGPCLSDEIIPGWVADIAHQPRTAADDDPANQCSAFKQGKATHFVELDEDGNFLRAY